MSRETETADIAWTADVVASRLGIDRSRVLKMRDAMTENIDWRRIGREKVFTAAGLARLEAQVKAALSPPPLEQGATPEAAKPANGHPAWATPPDASWKPFTPAPATVVTVRRRLGNPYVLEGALDDGTIVRLRVRPSEKWIPGLRLPSVPIGEKYFEYHGRAPSAHRRW